MGDRTDALAHRPPGRSWVRHGVAAGLAAALNLGLAFYLAAWSSRDTQAEPVLVRTVPLDVVEMELEDRDVALSRAVENIVPARPEASEPQVASLPELRATTPVPDTWELPVPELPDGSADSGTVLPRYVASAAALHPASGPGGTLVGPAEPVGPVRIDRGPVLFEPPDLSAYYPYRARIDGVTGRTRVRVTVDADGGVLSVRVLSSAPAGVFETAARRVCRTLRFRPALRDGRPVAAAVLLNLVWRLE